MSSRTSGEPQGMAPVPDWGRRFRYGGVRAVVDLAIGATSAMPYAALRSIADLRRVLDVLEREQVTLARQSGMSWADIGWRLRVTRQAAHAKHAGLVRERLSNRSAASD